MMITEKMIELQQWYARSMEMVEKFGHLPAQREVYKREARKAEHEFYETYGKDLLCIMTQQ